MDFLQSMHQRCESEIARVLGNMCDAWNHTVYLLNHFETQHSGRQRFDDCKLTLMYRKSRKNLLDCLRVKTWAWRRQNQWGQASSNYEKKSNKWIIPSTWKCVSFIIREKLPCHHDIFHLDISMANLDQKSFMKVWF